MDISLWISIPMAALTASVIAAHYYYKKAFTFWEAQGVKGPRAYPFFGNFMLLLLFPEAPSEWAKKYGKVYGIYEGKQPVLVVSDPAVMRQLCIKDFNKFPNHAMPEYSSEMTTSFIFGLKDDHWHRVRALLSPTFTSGKMRRIFRLINACATDMLANIQKQTSETESVLKLKDIFNLYTMDGIASCCYGLRLMGHRDKESPEAEASRQEFIRTALEFFNPSLVRLLLIASLPPKLLKKLKITFIPDSSESSMARRVQQIIDRRRESGRTHDDYLQTLISAKIETGETDSSSEDHLDHVESHHAGGKAEATEGFEGFAKQNGKLLSEIEILASATFLMVVGTETTSSLLTNCCFALSFHPDIQEKLYRTLKSIATENDDGQVSFDYDSLISCQYLDAVISETQRAHPSAIMTDRYASVDYHLESHNVFLPQGTKVAFALKAIMRDPDYWPEPEVFNPDRFLPGQSDKIVPNSYCPFGVGPRHCLGMRFSLAESKIALARLLMEFKLEPAPGWKYPAKNPKWKNPFTLARRLQARIIKR